MFLNETIKIPTLPLPKIWPSWRKAINQNSYKRQCIFCCCWMRGVVRKWATCDLMRCRRKEDPEKEFLSQKACTRHRPHFNYGISSSCPPPSQSSSHTLCHNSPICYGTLPSVSEYWLSEHTNCETFASWFLGNCEANVTICIQQTCSNYFAAKFLELFCDTFFVVYWNYYKDLSLLLCSYLSF